MKRLFLLFAIIGFFNSCSIDDNNPVRFETAYMPVQSVNIPESFMLGGTYEISMTYTAPNDCYEFNRFLYEVTGNVRTVVIENSVYTSNECNNISEIVQVSFDLVVTSNETYVFHFWQGRDNEGQDQYYVVEVPVVE